MNSFSCDMRIVADAEVRQHNGTSFASFRGASNTGFGDNQSTLWLDCTLWGARGEKLAPSLVKGNQVFVSGDLSMRTWNKPDGTQGSALSLRVNELAYGKSKGGDSAPQGGQTDNQSAGDEDDEIPF